MTFPVLYSCFFLKTSTLRQKLLLYLLVKFVWCKELNLEIHPRLDKDQNFGRNVDVLRNKQLYKIGKAMYFLLYFFDYYFTSSCYSGVALNFTNF